MRGERGGSRSDVRVWGFCWDWNEANVQVLAYGYAVRYAVRQSLGSGENEELEIDAWKEATTKRERPRKASSLIYVLVSMENVLHCKGLGAYCGLD